MWYSITGPPLDPKPLASQGFIGDENNGGAVAVADGFEATGGVPHGADVIEQYLRSQ